MRGRYGRVSIHAAALDFTYTGEIRKPNLARLCLCVQLLFASIIRRTKVRFMLGKLHLHPVSNAVLETRPSGSTDYPKNET